MDTLWSERGYFGLLRKNHILVYHPIISYQRKKVYRVERMNIGKILLTHWCQQNIKMQPSQEILCYLLYDMRYLGMILLMIYVCTWIHMLNNVRLIVSNMFNEHGCPITKIKKFHPLWVIYCRLPMFSTRTYV